MTAYTDARALELLLSVIFYPHNSYCIHIDSKVAQYLVNNGKQLISDPKVAFEGFPICLIVGILPCLLSPSMTTLLLQITCLKYWAQAEPDFLETVQNIIECYRLRFPATHIHQSSRFDLQMINFKHEHEPIFETKFYI